MQEILSCCRQSPKTNGTPIALFTSIKLAISMKDVTKQEIMIQELKRRIEELNEELKRKDKDMEGRMTKIRREWDLREQEMAEIERDICSQSEYTQEL